MIRNREERTQKRRHSKHCHDLDDVRALVAAVRDGFLVEDREKKCRTRFLNRSAHYRAANYRAGLWPRDVPGDGFHVFVLNKLVEYTPRAKADASDPADGQRCPRP
jgi:hypothetical protein